MKRNDSFKKRTVAGNSVLVPTGPYLKIMNGMITLNSTGAHIWDFLAVDISKEELIHQLVDIYGEEHENLIEEVNSFLDELSKLDLISDD